MHSLNSWLHSRLSSYSWLGMVFSHPFLLALTSSEAAAIGVATMCRLELHGRGLAHAQLALLLLPPPTAGE